VFELLFTHPLWAYRTGTFAFASGWPLWMLFAVISCAVALIALSLWRQRALGWRVLLPIGVLQALFVALLALLLWRPVLNVERVRDRENVLAVMLDASASMAHLGERRGGNDAQSRLQEAVAAFRSDALDPLSRSFEVRLFGFADRLTPLPDLEAIPPPGSQTRIGDAIVNILQQAASVPLAGIVLISDGAENGDSLTEERLEQLAGFGVPVHTVGVGPLSARNDIELEWIDLPNRAPQGATLTAHLGLRHHGIDSTRVRVYDRNTLIASRELKLVPNTQTTQLALDLPSGAPGTRELRFVLDPAPGEANVINNERTRIVEVPAERRSILYVDGEPRWEFKFLRRAATADNALRLASLVRTTPNKRYRQGVNSPRELEDGFPRRAEDLFAYDAVVIGSYEASSLTPDQHRLLTEYVDRRGGSVLMLAGRNGLATGGWSNSALAQTLPVRLPSSAEAAFVQRTASVALTSYGAQSPILQLEATEPLNRQRWRGLPALADYQTLGPLKPGAIVLLDAVTDRGRAPLLAWQRYGRGATYVLGTASTFRWQMQLPPEDFTHETFWRQLLHALVARTPSRVSLSAERTSYDDERRVQFVAEIRNARFEPANGAHVELSVAPEHGAPFTQPMQPSGQNDGRYFATIDAQTPGVYRASIVARDGDTQLGEALTHVVRQDGVAEHFAAHQHRAVLERIAAVTGGRYWTLDELSGLAAAIPYSKAGVIQRLTLDLWNLPIVFIALLWLKLAEWGVRLKWGRL
jgi:uncharacterized membrane protein